MNGETSCEVSEAVKRHLWFKLLFWPKWLLSLCFSGIGPLPPLQQWNPKAMKSFPLHVHRTGQQAACIAWLSNPGWGNETSIELHLELWVCILHYPCHLSQNSFQFQLPKELLGLPPPWTCGCLNCQGSMLPALAQKCPEPRDLGLRLQNLSLFWLLTHVGLLSCSHRGLICQAAGGASIRGEQAERCCQGSVGGKALL